MKNSQQNHNMRAYIDIINEGIPISEAHISDFTQSLIDKGNVYTGKELGAINRYERTVEKNMALVRRLQKNGAVPTKWISWDKSFNSLIHILDHPERVDPPTDLPDSYVSAFTHKLAGVGKDDFFKDYNTNKNLRDDLEGRWNASDHTDRESNRAIMRAGARGIGLEDGFIDGFFPDGGPTHSNPDDRQPADIIQQGMDELLKFTHPNSPDDYEIYDNNPKIKEQEENMRQYIDIINEGIPISEAHIDFPYLPPELELNMNPTEISDWRQRKIDDYLGAHGKYNPYKANEFTNAVTNKAMADLEATDDLTIKNDRAFGDPLPDEPIDDLEDDIPLAVSKLALKTDPFDELGYTPIDTKWSDVVSKEEAQRDDIPDSYKLATTITGKLMHDDGTYSHITANPDGGGKIDSSVRDAIIYTKKLKAKLAVKKAAAAVAKAKKDKEEIEAATARFMASKEAKSQRDRFDKSHSVEHSVAKKAAAKKEKYDSDVQAGRARFLAMRKKQEEERKARREFLRKQQIENQKKRQTFYNSMYGRRPYR